MGHQGSIALVAVVAIALAPAAFAQTVPDAGHIQQPEYMSGASAGALTGQDMNTAEAEGRPGWKFFNEGMQSYKEGHFSHALYMLKLAAYWGYEPAAYNLGVFYFQGENVPVNRALGTAWMFIAAQDGSSVYKSARHMMVENLDSAGRTRALAYYEKLQRKYGQAAGRRADARWAYVKSQATGSRVGGAGSAELRVGSALSDSGGTPHTAVMSGTGNVMAGGVGAARRDAAGVKNSAVGILNAATAEDGSVAYHQFQQSNNPYASVLVKNRAGKATVGPLHEVARKAGAASSQAASRVQPAAAASSGEPQGN